jgi:hypothetical protein
VENLRAGPVTITDGFPLSTFPFHLLLLRRIITRLFVMGGTVAQSSDGPQMSLSGHSIADESEPYNRAAMTDHQRWSGAIKEPN